jgi:hypothetical protein
MHIRMIDLDQPGVRDYRGSRQATNPVCTEDSNPDVVMVKSAQNGVRTYEAGSLNRTRDRRILVQ